jgi:hypothetical protein
MIELLTTADLLAARTPIMKLYVQKTSVGAVPTKPLPCLLSIKPFGR